MALTFTLTGLQTELSGIETALEASNVANARKAFARYCAVRAGLPEQVKGTLDEAKYPNPEQLKAGIDAWATETEAGSAARSNMRFGRMRVSRRG